MSKMSGRRRLTAILSLLTLGAALSVGLGKAVAADDVTEDQIVRALVPEKKPLTRGLSTGPQTTVDPAAAAAEGKFVQKIRGRSTRSLSSAEREEIAERYRSEGEGEAIAEDCAPSGGGSGRYFGFGGERA